MRMEMLEDGYGNVIVVKNISGITGVYENEAFLAGSPKMEEKPYYFKIIAGIVWTRYYDSVEEAQQYRSVIIDALKNA